MKYLKYILFIVGVFLLFFGEAISVYGAYLKILGLIVFMFSVYLISSGLTSKEKKSDTDNLRF